MSLRYSIYKVQTSFVSFILMSAANFYILAHLVEFVKHFLQSFLNSFVLFAALQAIRFTSRNFLSLTHPVRFVKNFFLIFEILLCFAPLSRTACIYYHLIRRLSSTFSQIPTIFFVRFNCGQPSFLGAHFPQKSPKSRFLWYTVCKLPYPFRYNIYKEG